MAKNSFKSPIVKQRHSGHQTGLLAPVQNNEEHIQGFNYRYNHISLEKIIFLEPIKKESEEKIQKVKESIKKHGQINPIILKEQYTIEEKFGMKTKIPSGKFEIVTGEEIFIALKNLYEETKNRNFSMISSLILPIDATDEQIEEIINSLNVSSEEKSIEEKIMETKGETIDFCFDYQEVSIEPERLREEHNTFDIEEEEVKALAESIRLYGMWELPLILPYLDENGEILYRIVAGHKRIRAVKLIKKKASNNEYENSNLILKKLNTIKVRLLPLGCTKEQERAVHEYSNLMRRQISLSQALDHIYMIPELPPIPSSKAEYDNFMNNYSMSKLGDIVINYFRALGFRDWKFIKAQRFLSVYYFGSERVKEEFRNSKSVLNQKELVWICTEFKDYFARKKQDEIVDRAIKDKTFLIRLMEERKVKRKSKKSISYKKYQEKILKETASIKKLLDSNLEEADDMYDVITMKKYLSSLKDQVQKLEEKIELASKKEG